jgi:hypothetical protein
MTPTIVFDDHVLKRRINALSSALRKKPAEIVARIARQWVEICIQLTPPTGKSPLSEGSGAALEAGRKAIESDVSRLFKSAEDIDIIGPQGSPATDVGKQFWKAARRGNMDVALDIVRKAGLQFGSVARVPDSSIHQRNRGSTGRVLRKPIPHLITAGGRIKSYIANVQRKIGYARSGWKDAAQALGARGRYVPAWMNRHNGPGRIDGRLTGFHPYVTFANEVGYIQRAGRKLRIMAAGHRILVRKLDAELTALAGINRRAWKRG